MKEILKSIFPGISEVQTELLSSLENLLREWNEKINLISRKDTNNIFIHHILHSLSIAKFIRFYKNTTVMDLGSGGGLPGIPLAVMFPETNFLLVDRTGKKMMAASEIAKALNLGNVTAMQSDANNIKHKFDFIVSRGVMPLPDLIKISKKLIAQKSFNQIPNGLICLKGGDLEEELKPVKYPTIIVPLSDYFPQSFFETKKLIYTGLVK